MSLIRAASSPLRSCVTASQRGGVVLQQVAHASTSTQGSSSSSASSSSSFRPLPQTAAEEVLTTRIKPVPASFYTTRPTYIDSLILLEDLAKKVKRALQQLNIPIPSAEDGVSSSSSSPKRAPEAWLKAEPLSKKLGIPLKSSQYRNIAVRLKELSQYRYLARNNFLDGQHGPDKRALALNIEETLSNFARDPSAANQEQPDEFYSSSTHVDELGRAYARGRRKESSARVWIVPKMISAEGEGESLISQSLLINLQSLPDTFTRVAHRETVLHPLRLTGLLGVINVFALVRGGGLSGQAGALAHGVARAIVTLFDHQAKEAERKGTDNAKDLRLKAITVRDVLAKDGVLVRDPRMVERKKTGLAKARKAYTWVKR